MAQTATHRERVRIDVAGAMGVQWGTHDEPLGSRGPSTRHGPPASGRTLKATASNLLQRLPGKATEKWPLGERFALALRHGSMSVELYAPTQVDPQTPHQQDELYFIHSGTGVLVIAGERHPFEPGTCFFVPAGVRHHFEGFSESFSTWVVFWGPEGGETSP